MGVGTMSIETVRSVLLWCGIINYGILIFWALLFLFARGPLHRISRWYGLSSEHFDLIQFCGISLYKLGIFFFNLVPYVALRLVA